jgi:hypothetical protein
MEYFHGKLLLDCIAAFLGGVATTLGTMFILRVFRRRRH